MIREDVLDQAKDRVMTKSKIHGEVESSFDAIATAWSIYLGMNITSRQVCEMMILMKLQRINYGAPTLDSYVDIAGYSALAAEIAAGDEE